MLPCSHESEHTATHTHVADHSHTHAHVHRLVISINGLRWPILVFYSDTNTITSTTRQRSTIMTTRRVTLTATSRFDVTKLRTKYNIWRYLVSGVRVTPPGGGRMRSWPWTGPRTCSRPTWPPSTAGWRASGNDHQDDITIVITDSLAAQSSIWKETNQHKINCITNVDSPKCTDWLTVFILFFLHE